MKKILILLVCLLLSWQGALAQVTRATAESDLQGLRFGNLQSQRLSELLTGDAYVAENLSPDTNSAWDLGTAALSYEDLFVEKILADNDSTSALDADVTTATTAAPLCSIVGTTATQSHLALVQNVASAQGADVVALKTRAAAGATNANTIVASGDDILKIRAYGANGASYDEAAQLLFESGGTPGASADMPGRVRVLISPDGSATPAEILDLAATTAVEIFARADAQRLFSLDGSSDTALTLTFGDAGTTAVQQLTISASTADADDDSTTFIAGGGATGATRGSWISLPGEEVAGGSDVEISAGTGDEVQLSVADTAELTVQDDQLVLSGAAVQVVPGATSLTFRNNADSADNLAIVDAGSATFRDTILSTRTTDLGWAVVAGANTACNTTCTNACVFGVNTAATEADIVACTDATADECLCAGAS